MTYDLLIRGGTVVDGTGCPGFVADVAITNGSITEIGKLSGTAHEVIDADGLIVAPGFIDNHTHYDGQICWDPLLTPSCWHGVTTAIMGNCGLGVAPMRPEGRGIAVENLVCVEGMSKETLTAGVDWDWDTFPEYIQSMKRRQPGINVGFLSGLSAFRHYVLGEEAMERASTPAETEKIKELLRESIKVGSLGFSFSRLPNDIGFKGKPVASRLAPNSELEAYAGVLRELGKGVIQFAMLTRVGEMSEEEYALVDMLLEASGRPLTWLALLTRADKPSASMAILDRCNEQHRRGAWPAVTVRPLIASLQIKSDRRIMAELPSMQKVFAKDIDTQIAVCQTPEFRASLRVEMAKPGLVVWNWSNIEVGSVENPALKALEGRSVADIARERGADPVDVFLDIAVEDRLETNFNMPLFNTDDKLCAELFTDPRTLIGLSDGGAHALTLCDAGYTTYMLGKWVREKKAISLEQAVRKLTSAQADFLGIRDRGRLQVGLAADVVVFDATRVGSSLKPEIVQDFPAGGQRMITRPTGIEHVIVNGQCTVRGLIPTGARAGTIVHN